MLTVYFMHAKIRNYLNTSSKHTCQNTYVCKYVRNTYVRMWPALGKSTVSMYQLKFTFCLYVKVTLMHYPVLNHKWSDLLSQTAFCWGYLITRMYFLALRGIDRIAWATKLLLMAVLAHPVDCITSCHILKAQNCCLSRNGCFSPPLAPRLRMWLVHTSI